MAEVIAIQKQGFQIDKTLRKTMREFSNVSSIAPWKEKYNQILYDQINKLAETSRSPSVVREAISLFEPNEFSISCKVVNSDSVSAVLNGLSDIAGKLCGNTEAEECVLSFINVLKKVGIHTKEDITTGSIKLISELYDSNPENKDGLQEVFKLLTKTLDLHISKDKTSAACKILLVLQDIVHIMNQSAVQNGSSEIMNNSGQTYKIIMENLYSFEGNMLRVAPHLRTDEAPNAAK
ncbi:MAG: hypothetical protein ABR981_01005 [Candidatus Micrarchaeaceae archaeon]|jgi:hypothetical protein